MEGLDIRSAFVSMDLESMSLDNSLSITLSRLHAVMSPSSVGEFGDLIDYVQVIMIARHLIELILIHGFLGRDAKTPGTTSG
jgi:hypothetical protein